MKKKAIIGLLIILVIYFVVMFSLNNKGKTDKSNDNYVIFNNLNLVHQEHSLTETEKTNITNYKGKFETFINGTYFGEYNLEAGNVWNLFDNNNFVKYDGKLLAVVPRLKDNVITYTNSSISQSDRNYIESKYKINKYDYLTDSGAYTFKVNDDEYKIIILNYLDSTTFDPVNNYNLVIVKRNDKYIELSFNKKDAIKIYDIIGIVEFNDNKDIYIGFNVTSNINTDIEKEQDVVYKLENNRLKKVVSN